MGLDINSLKDFFPFGSAMLGAMTGGLITYNITKAKEKKEKHQKRVESIFELQAKLSEMLNETIDFKMETLLLGGNDSKNSQGSEQLHFLKKLKTYFHEKIIRNREILCSLAIHIDKNVFVRVGKAYNEIFDIFGKTNKENFQGDIHKDFEAYLELVVCTMNEIILKINHLIRYLLKKEHEHVKYFLEKYI
ncbi:TPA: hypothetical protein QCY30_002160 [Bacillus toyonensis]|nr:hypothetical protein [Bacillus toyonensis]